MAIPHGGAGSRQATSCWSWTRRVLTTAGFGAAAYAALAAGAGAVSADEGGDSPLGGVSSVANETVGTFGESVDAILPHADEPTGPADSSSSDDVRSTTSGRIPEDEPAKEQRATEDQPVIVSDDRVAADKPVIEVAGAVNRRGAETAERDDTAGRRGSADRGETPLAEEPVGADRAATDETARESQTTGAVAPATEVVDPSAAAVAPIVEAIQPTSDAIEPGTPYLVTEVADRRETGGRDEASPAEEPLGADRAATDETARESQATGAVAPATEVAGSLADAVTPIVETAAPATGTTGPVVQTVPAASATSTVTEIVDTAAPITDTAASTVQAFSDTAAPAAETATQTVVSVVEVAEPATATAVQTVTATAGPVVQTVADAAASATRTVTEIVDTAAPITDTAVSSVQALSVTEVVQPLTVASEVLVEPIRNTVTAIAAPVFEPLIVTGSPEIGHISRFRSGSTVLPDFRPVAETAGAVVASDVGRVPAPVVADRLAMSSGVGEGRVPGTTWIDGVRRTTTDGPSAPAWPSAPSGARLGSMASTAQGSGGSPVLISPLATLPSMPIQLASAGMVSTAPVATLQDGSDPEPSYSPD